VRQPFRIGRKVRGRESGLLDALLFAVENWARTEGDQLTLHVHEDDARARKAYERRGFVTTGHTVPYILDTSKNELEMVKKLSLVDATMPPTHRQRHRGRA
jgi:ribosomal protein S18 acetylase RimI-like enzyme